MIEDVLRGTTLLIVEDEVDLREPLATEFESWGCEVFQAGDGKGAFELVQRHKIDAVVTDVRMPGGDGVELLAKIKDLNDAVPVVMLITGFADLSKEDAYDLGAEFILAKPFSLDEILAAVRRIVTDRDVRWRGGPNVAEIRHHIEAGFTDFATAVAKGAFGIGRGGLFLSSPAAKPAREDLVGFHIRFAHGDLHLIEGAGVVRWLRSEETHGLPAGVGIEFETLSTEARAAVLTLTAKLKIKAYIPKAAGPTLSGAA